jgi:hypothetical protein
MISMLAVYYLLFIDTVGIAFGIYGYISAKRAGK